MRLNQGANMKIILPVAAVFLVTILCRGQGRYALILGNADYGEGNRLKNPVNDASDMEKALRDLRFQTSLHANLDLDGMEQAVVSFRKDLGPGDVAVFFYAGHGLEVDGVNYLVPVGVQLREAFEAKRKTLPVGYVLDALEESGANLKVIILDCCRDNPWKRSWSRSTSGAGGLAAMTAPEGTLIAFSTAPGAVAADGSGRNSPFSQHLVEVFRSRPPEGLELTGAIRAASRLVKQSHEQTPWLSFEASLEPYFLSAPSNGKTEPARARPFTQAPMVETEASPDLSLVGTALAERFLEALANNDPGSLLSLVSNPVDYYEYGAYSKEQVRRDLDQDSDAYPSRSYGIAGTVQVNREDGGGIQVEFPMRYELKSRSGKSATGHLRLSLDWTGADGVITSIKREVISAKK